MEAGDFERLSGLVDGSRVSRGESVLDLHSMDQSHHGPFRPDLVIWPINAGEVSSIVSYCNQRKVPVTAWGAGSSLEGNPVPIKGGVVLNFSNMNRILEIRPNDFQADVEPGLVYQDLNERMRHHGLFFPPDPGARATVGGMIANNASGTRTVRYGSTRDYVLRLKVVLATGELVQIGSWASKSSSGYDLLHLFVGSEGTLGLIVEATLRLVAMPPQSSAIVACFRELGQAANAVFDIMRGGLDPALLEVLSHECVELINREMGLGLPHGVLLFVEFLGPSLGYLKEVTELAEEVLKEKGSIRLESGIGRERRDSLLKARHLLGEMIIRKNPERGFLTTDMAVPISRFQEMLVFAKERTSGIRVPSYIFSHAGNGNIHVVMMGKKGDDSEWAEIEAINEALVLRALDLGGTCTGEHGIGIGKKRFMELEHGRSLVLMKKIKELLDPNGILNPGKVL